MSTPIHWFSQNPNTEQTFECEKPYVAVEHFMELQAALKQAVEGLAEALARMRKYEMDVDESPTLGHRLFMKRAERVITAAQPHLPAQREGKPE